MNKKASKLLHISSEQSQEDQKYENSQINSKKEKIKYQNFKSQSYQMQQNIFRAKNNEQDYILPEKIRQNKKKKINFVSEQYFVINNHTIKNQQIGVEQQEKTTQKECSLVQQLNKLNFANLTNQQQNPEKEGIRTARKTKNLLQVQLDDEDSQDQEIQTKVIQLQRNGQQGKEPEKSITQAVKQLIYDEELSKQKFITVRLSEKQMIIANVQRQKSGINYFLPQFDVVNKNDCKHIVSCKKQIGPTFQYNISIDNHNFSQKSVYFAGKIVGNFSNSVFNLVDLKSNSIICTSRFRQQNNGPIIAPMAYQIFILNQGQQYQNLAGIDTRGSSLKGLDQLHLIPINKKKISYFRNKKPEYCREIKAYMLNFNGRVSVGSVKNFIIQDSKSGREVLMFGKGVGQNFNLFISSPLNVVIAMSIVIPHFASKVFQK